MATAYRKTPKGFSEIETRANRLTPRLRALLIVVDGRRTAEELRALVGAELTASLQGLLDGGYIEALEIAGPATSPPQAAARVAPAPAAAPLSAQDLQTIRQAAVRALNDLMGPQAESVAIKMERARDSIELAALIEVAAKLVASARGANAAAQFRARFLRG